LSPLSLSTRLSKFVAEESFDGKGPLSVALVITERAKNLSFPIDSSRLISEGSEGQVIGLGKGAVQKILKRHGITKLLAHEGGRTSRGSIKNMRTYVTFLNELEEKGILDLEQIEQFWVSRVESFFSAKPFKLRVDQSQGLKMAIRNVVQQATERQKASTGTSYAGAVLQHLVGAKLDCVLGEGKLKHHSFSTSDLQTSRAGDFLVGDTAIHVTSSPLGGVIERCKANIEAGLRPIIVTTERGADLAEGYADTVGMANRIDIFEIEQFVALNVYEMGKFMTAGQQAALGEIIDRYNAIVTSVETDPSLCIERS
jgi:hypothetical protein